MHEKDKKWTNIDIKEAQIYETQPRSITYKAEKDNEINNTYPSKTHEHC